MTSVGIMASAVVSGVCTDVLAEPFNNLTAWANNGATINAAGRTGTCCQTVPINSTRYSVTGAQESATFTVGFAYFVNGTQSSGNIIQFLSDTGTTIHLALGVGTTGNLTVNRGGSTQIGSAAPGGTIVTSAWQYIEMQATLHDTAGAFSVRVNGTVVASGTNVDTKNAGTKSVFDAIRLGSGGGGAIAWRFDDLYLSTGSGCAFKGSITIP